MAVRRRLLTFALGLPEAYEDHPWGETVAKVNKKVFVFLGVAEPGVAEPGVEQPADGPDDRTGFTVKLADSHEAALSVPGAKPTGYGLGRAGWVTVRLGADAPPADVCADWIEESYRIIAPKRLVQRLDR